MKQEWPDHVVNDPRVKRILALWRPFGVKMFGLGMFVGGWIGQQASWVVYVGIGIVVLAIILEPSDAGR